MSKAFNETKRDLELDDKLPFGKFSGCIIEDVCLSDPGYILWMIANTNTTFDWYVMNMAIKEKFKTKPKTDSYTSSLDGRGTGGNPFDLGPDLDDVPW